MKILVKILLVLGFIFLSFWNSDIFAVDIDIDYTNNNKSLIIENNYLNDQVETIIWNTSDTPSVWPVVEKNLDMAEKNLDMAEKLWSYEDVEKAKKLVNDIKWTRSECKSPDWITTSILYDKTKQSPFCYSTKENWYSCTSWTCESKWVKWTTLRVYTDWTGTKTWLNLIQSFLSTILWFILKFAAMLAVLAIVLWWIQVSMSMEWESSWPWKDKIIWWIASLVVIFFAWVILNFINPAYFTWWSSSSNSSGSSQVESNNLPIEEPVNNEWNDWSMDSEE